MNVDRIRCYYFAISKSIWDVLLGKTAICRRARVLSAREICSCIFENYFDFDESWNWKNLLEKKILFLESQCVFSCNFLQFQSWKASFSRIRHEMIKEHELYQLVKFAVKFLKLSLIMMFVRFEKVVLEKY